MENTDEWQSHLFHLRKIRLNFLHLKFTFSYLNFEDRFGFYRLEEHSWNYSNLRYD